MGWFETFHALIYSKYETIFKVQGYGIDGMPKQDEMYGCQHYKNGFDKQLRKICENAKNAQILNKLIHLSPSVHSFL